MRSLTCPRCQKLYSVKFSEHAGPLRHPLLLRCGHTFCSACIQKLQKDETVNCPTCQAPTKVGGEFYKSVQPDKFIVGCMWRKRMDLEIQSQKISGRPSEAKVRMKETRRHEAVSGDKSTSCSECQANTAVCQCYKCEGIMCKSCFDKIHQRSHTLQKHKAVALMAPAFVDKPGSQKVILPGKKTTPRNCLSHDQCQIEYYCEDDQQPICSRCVIMGDHKGHNVQTMEDKNKALLAEMEPAVVNTQETLWRLEKSEKLVAQSMPTGKVDEDLVEEVQNSFMTFHSLLQAREEQLLDEIRAASDVATKSSQEIKSYLQNEKLKLEEALMDAARAKHGSLHSLVDADLILERLKRAKDLPCVVTIKRDAITAPIKFSHEGSMQDTIQQYGNVSVAHATQIISLNAAGQGSEKPPAEELRLYSVADIDTESQSTTDSLSVSGSVAVEGDRNNDSDSVDEKVASAEVMDARPVSFPPLKRLIVGNNEQVNVTHILTPGHFYVQLDRQQVEIESLHQHINQYCYSSKNRNRLPGKLETGNLVLALYDVDKKWYRARVVEVITADGLASHSKDTFKVFFLDYGNTAVISKKKMRKMEKRFTVHSMFAHECALYDILPANEKVGWTRESADTMLQMTRIGPLLMVVVNEAGDRLEVDLGSTDRAGLGLDECPVSVRDSLVFLGLAIFNTRGPHQGGVSFPAVVSMRKREYLTLPRVDQGTILNIGINCTQSPTLFYAQPYSEDSHSHLHSLLIAMQDVYSQQTKHLYKVYCPKMGMMCVARYARDSNWYRARVTAIPGPQQVEVQFVDYGNRELVNIADICKILDDHIKFPMQALEVTLADVEPEDDAQWSEGASEWFRSMTELQLCQFRVTERSERPNSLVGVLYIINSQTDRLCCVNYEMVKLGLAKSTGPWSLEESFTGVTLSQEMLGSVRKSSSSSSTSPLPGSYRIGSPPLHTSLPQPPPPRSSDTAQGKTKKSRTARSRGKPARSSTVPLSALNQGASTVAPQTGATSTTTTTVVDPSPQVVMVKREVELEVGESTELEKGAADGCVSAYSSPSHFYIQLEEKDDELLQLMMDLKVYERAHQSNRRWKVGEFCAAKGILDQRWYRGQILEENEETGTFSVQLVDFGQVLEIPSMNMKPLRRIHSKQECFAERCHIADLMPTGTTDRGKWSSTATDFIKQLIGPKNVYIKLKGDRMQELGLPVDLLLEESIEPTALDPGMVKYVSVAAKLQDRGLAIPIKREKSPQCCDPGAEKSTVDMFSTKPVPTLPNSCEDVDNDDDEEEEESKDEGEDGRDAVTSTIITQPDFEVAPHPPPLSSRIHVMPVHVDSQGIIYAQDFVEGEVVQTFLENLQEYCEKVAPPGLLQVTEGQVCMAFCKAYRYWLRARVLSVGPRNVKVKYIDYGNIGKVSKTQLKLINATLCSKHQLTYELRLDGASPTNDEDAEEYIERLGLDFINKDCTALVQGNLKDRPLLVDLGDYKKDEADSDSSNAKSSDSMIVFCERSNDIADTLELPNPYSQLKVENKGSVIHAMVTHLELPNVVFLQRCDSPVDGTLPRDLQDFGLLMGELNSLPPQTPIMTELPPEGSMCSARFGQDDRWYRGLVAKVYPKDKEVLVLYVDYGNSEVVPLGNRLRVLPQRFQAAPTQSVRACLNLTMPRGVYRWPRSTYRAMVLAIFEKKHRVFIKETSPLTIDLYDREDGVSLSYASLIQEGLVAVPQANKSRRIEVSDEETSTEEEGSANSD